MRYVLRRISTFATATLAVQVLLELIYIFVHKARFVLFLYPFVNILTEF